MKIRSQKAALREAAKRWGKNAAVRDEGAARASSPEKREEAARALAALNAAQSEERTSEWRKERDRNIAWSMHYRYSVGAIVMGLAFLIHGQGDTWDAAFSDADAKGK